MFGLLIIVVIYLVLGFTLAWIANMVAQEDVEVKTGVLVLFLTWLITFGIRYALNATLPDLTSWIMPPVYFATLILLLNLITKLSWKHSAIIALIYTVILWAAFFGLSSCM